jgi:hypothetical protein
LDLQITLSKDNQKTLGKWLKKLPLEEEVTHYNTLRVKGEEDG